MRVIKRYSNRKLYDTRERKYVTLEEVGRLVRDGEDVKVRDNVTGEDLTTVTLSQIVTEKERRHKNKIPKAFLTSVLQRGARLKNAVFEKSGKFLGDGLENALRTLRIPSRSEFDQLSQVVEGLEKSLRKLEKAVRGPKAGKTQRGE